MLLWCLLVSLALSEPTVSTNPGVKDQNPQWPDYGLKVGLGFLEEKLKSLNIPDLSGSKWFSQYRLSGMRITDLGLPQSSLGLARGISLSSGNAFMNLHGDWHVKYLGFIQDSGSFDLAVSGLINITIAYGNITNCVASLSDFRLRFEDRWFHNIIEWFYRECLRRYFEMQICPGVHDVGLNLLTDISNKSTIFVSVIWGVIGIIGIITLCVICFIFVYKRYYRSGYSRI